MAAQEYYDSFREPANTIPFQANPQRPSPGTSPQSHKHGGATLAPYPNPPYPTTPEPLPQRQTPPYPHQPHSRQYLAPPGGPPPDVERSYFPPQARANGYLPSGRGPRPSDPYAYPPRAPIVVQRSTSEPPKNRRISLSTTDGRHRDHRRKQHYSRDDSSDYDDRSDSDRSRSRSRSHSRHQHRHDQRRASERSRSTRNVFLGAGGGAIVGDAILPGLGTLGGMLLGGWGGHEYSKRRSKSEGKYEYSGSQQRPQYGKGRKGIYGEGIAARSEWGLIEVRGRK